MKKLTQTTLAEMPGGVDEIAVVVGVRYANGYVVPQRFDFTVAVP